MRVHYGPHDSFYLFQNGKLSIPDRFHYFLDDFWNFQNFVKIWTRNPPNYCQFTLKNTRKIWEHPWKIWIWEIWESENLKISGSPVYRTSRFFSNELSFFLLFLILEYDNIMKWWKFEDEEFLEIHFPGGISWKAWIWISFRSKTMKHYFPKTNQLFYFGAR